MTDLPTVGVIMAVYERVQPDHLAEALQSLGTQTLSPSEVIVVEDGPLPDALLKVLDETEGLPLRRIALEKNLGSGPAKQVALLASRSVLVAVADADDVSMPTRLAEQAALMTEGPLDLASSAMEEFDTETGDTVGVRAMPTTHAGVARMMRMRNPMNHPAVMVRRDRAVASGGYRDLPLLEDYDLWARMLRDAARTGNSPRVLVRFRGGKASWQRRRARQAFASEYRLQKNLRRYGVVNRTEAARNLLVRCGYRLIPLPLLSPLYRRLFTKKEAP